MFFAAYGTSPNNAPTSRPSWRLLWCSDGSRRSAGAGFQVLVDCAPFLVHKGQESSPEANAFRSVLSHGFKPKERWDTNRQERAIVCRQTIFIPYAASNALPQLSSRIVESCWLFRRAVDSWQLAVRWDLTSCLRAMQLSKIAVRNDQFCQLHRTARLQNAGNTAAMLLQALPSPQDPKRKTMTNALGHTLPAGSFYTAQNTKSELKGPHKGRCHQYSWWLQYGSAILTRNW